jgi:hypothetical protein
MPRTSIVQGPATRSGQEPWYPADFLPQLQSTLGALADLEIRYQGDQEQLRAWAGSEAIKKQFAAQLKECYLRDREPYLQRLAELQQILSRIVSVH